MPVRKSWRVRLTPFVLLVSVAVSGTANAGTINSGGHYQGTIGSVAVNFFEGIGVALDGVTCNGSTVVYLPYTNGKYKEILSVLVTAQASGQNVRLYRLLDTISTFPGGYSYCTVTAASLGDFPLWQ